ncbi:MAG: rubredoxin [Candidatus Sabulitectum sp.]|nr:rubredoxin [Candidatus Sabulitectum sp.]
MVWECQACSYIYDSRKVGETAEDPVKVPSPADLPEDWVCPVCGVGSEFLEEVSGRSS